jgi:hypothetical protein
VRPSALLGPPTMSWQVALPRAPFDLQGKSIQALIMSAGHTHTCIQHHA